MATPVKVSIFSNGFGGSNHGIQRFKILNSQASLPRTVRHAKTDVWSQSQMINISLYLGFIAATFVLLAIPCPNIMMILAKSSCCGTRAGLLTVAGMTVAQALQILIVVLGLSWIVNT